MNSDLVAYYRDRAKEYELIYEKPERQTSLAESASILCNLFRDKHVIEIACGTGYWTERIARTAASVTATDINEAVIDIAKSKEYGNTPVEFVVEDLFILPSNKKYDALFGGFIWSHILLQDLDAFVGKVNTLVKPGGLVVLMDNVYVEGSNTAIDHIDESGNSWQRRKLEDGREHIVLKNFPNEHYLRERLGRYAINIKYYDLGYYWIISCKVC